MGRGPCSQSCLPPKKGGRAPFPELRDHSAEALRGPNAELPPHRARPCGAASTVSARTFSKAQPSLLLRPPEVGWAGAMKPGPGARGQQRLYLVPCCPWDVQMLGVGAGVVDGAAFSQPERPWGLVTLSASGAR